MLIALNMVKKQYPMLLLDWKWYFLTPSHKLTGACHLAHLGHEIRLLRSSRVQTEVLSLPFYN